MYEQTEDGDLVAIGSPGDVKLVQVKQRILAILTSDWQTTREVRSTIGKPTPSSEQVLQALDQIAGDGDAERDPPLSEGSKKGSTYKWRAT